MNDQKSTEARTTACKCLLGPVSKKLIVCIDGTSNQFGLKNTNIVELYSNLHENAKQLTYYDSGIGTAARSSWISPGTALKQWIDTQLDLALALNIEKIILRAYVWLCNHFNEDDTGVDEIYLFGFSRGAYQVRALAGMIETASAQAEHMWYATTNGFDGYLGNEAQVPFAYEIYANLGTRRRSDAEKAKFKATFSRKYARVHFLGIWDTVKTVSIHPIPTPLVVGDYNHVCFVRHALALDEYRSLFLHLPISNTPSHAINPPNENFPEVHIKEVWFAGTHSEVGGGHEVNTELDSGNISLSWMRQEAQLAGLLASTPDLRFRLLDRTSLPNKQLEGRWKLLQLLVKRPQRRVRSDQKIHASVLFKGSNYKPEALITPEIEPYPPLMMWDDEESPSKVAILDSRWEKGIFDLSSTGIMMDKLREGKQLQLVHYIAFYARSFEGKKSIMAMENATQNPSPRPKEILQNIAQSAAMSADIRIGAVVALVELDMALNECARYLRELHEVAKSDKTDVEFRCRFMDSLHRLVKRSQLRGVIKDDVIPTITRLIERGQATSDREGEATHERLLDACVRALYAVIMNVNYISQMVPDTDRGPADTLKTGSYQPILISGTMKSVLEKKYGIGHFANISTGKLRRIRTPREISSTSAARTILATPP